MTRFALIPAALLIAMPAAAQVETRDPPASEAQEGSGTKLKSLLQNCDAHKFETTVESTVDGKPHRSKLKMCGTEGQSDADWIGTLKDAIAKLESNSEMPASTRDQVITAINAEIARLNAEMAKQASAGPLPAGRAARSPEPLSNDYTMLPPLPSAPAPAAKVEAPSASSLLGESGAAAASGPATVEPTKVVPLAPPKAVQPALPKPRLSFTCISPEFPAGGPCVTLTRDTILTVKSGDALPGGVALQFLRKGEQRAEVSLGSMRKGQTLRLDLPRPVCSGVVTSEVEISILRNGRSVGREGPYLLRC